MHKSLKPSNEKSKTEHEQNPNFIAISAFRIDKSTEKYDNKAILLQV